VQLKSPRLVIAPRPGEDRAAELAGLRAEVASLKDEVRCSFCAVCKDLLSRESHISGFPFSCHSRHTAVRNLGMQPQRPLVRDLEGFLVDLPRS
jgi:hypothetical protein